MNRKGKFQDRFFTITTQAEFAYYKSESTDEEPCKPPVSLLTLTEVRIPSTDPLAPKYAVDKTCFDLQFAGGKTMVLSELPTDMGSRAIGRTLRALATQEGRVAIATRAMGGPALPKIAAAAAQKMTEFPSQAEKGRTVRAEAAASTRMVAGMSEKGKKGKKKLTAMERMALLSGKSAASPTPSPRVSTNGNEKEKKVTASNSEKIKLDKTKVNKKVKTVSKHRRSITAPLVVVLKAAAKKASGTPNKNSKAVAAAAKASTEEEVAKKKTTTRTKKKKKKRVGSVAPEKQKKKKKPQKAAPAKKATAGATVPRTSSTVRRASMLAATSRGSGSSGGVARKEIATTTATANADSRGKAPSTVRRASMLSATARHSAAATHQRIASESIVRSSPFLFEQSTNY